ncbi:MAG: peptidoglycan-associated lipoprotein Pal [Acidobacteria bacterium]|nr:peptidoglycan-associated lipoprotein Pal [Acidobacteriota bacterium]MCG3194354.1 Outer membrane lipoprotein Omp16 [Thermoanaerobaculia bacterium]MCK6682537.1 peptidoglycan-associated lipoprotein Pal [Thermoanaerobaculia bacterium]
MKHLHRSLGLSLTALFVVVGLGCCAKKPTPTPAPEVKAPKVEPTPVPEPVKTPPPFKPAETKPVTDIDASLDEINRKGYVKDVFFDFDDDAIRADMRDVLEGNAAWLKKYPTVKIRVEGHCDERGTAQYNMALGERRAAQVKNYLVRLGLEEGRIETVSFGKEKPFATGSNEEAWSQNRRGHFVVIAK